ncbi:hypothetical protein EV363DRAFT_1291600 [Boletus edulis]|nr:hypothetical protein EV363DRAFT_1291600 [Boletus edulis]
MQACDVVREYLVARQVSFKTSTIQKAWAKSGISIDETGRPRTTPEIFGSADYAPSVPGSTQLQLPPGYPVFPADESDSESQSDYANSDMDTQPQHHLLHSSRTRHESPPQDKPVGDNTDFLDMKNELVELRKQLKLSEMKAKQADEKREEAETHATLAASHLQRLQGQLNAKSKKRGSGSRNVLIPSRIITSEGGRQEALKQREAREAKAKKEDERKQKKLDETLSIRDRRSREGKDTMSFTGALLKNHKAMVLRDVAWTLDLAEDGTREELITRITAFFEDPANRHLRDDDRYIGLFVSKRTLGKRPQHGFGDLTDENNAIPAGAPSERHCFGVITNTPPIAQESQFEHIFEYAFPAEESEQSQPLHTPGDWGMYHFGPDSRNTRYSCTLPGLQAPATMMGSSSLNFNEGSILSFMRQPPSFIHPQPGPSSYHPTFI